MKTVDDLLLELKILKIKKRCMSEDYITDVIDPDGFCLVENCIREFLLDHHDNEIGEMQGKIFAYEEIIKKSNFAPFVADNRFQDILLSMQKAIAEYESNKAVKKIPTSKLREETKETTEKETMFYTEFQQSDDFKDADCIEYFDLSGNVVEPKKRNKIFKYYKREVGNFKFLIVFIGKE